MSSKFIQGYDFDCKLIQDFERGLNLCSPEKSLIPCRVLGYGEISTVIEIQLEDLSGLAFKRMSIFESEDEIGDYIQLYQEYNRILEQDIGLGLPPHGYFVCESKSHRPIVYIIQKQVPYYSLGNKAMNLLQPEQAVVLFRCVLGELLRVWEYNQRSYDRQIAIDGQISNWAVDDFDPKNQFSMATATSCTWIPAPLSCV